MRGGRVLFLLTSSKPVCGKPSPISICLPGQLVARYNSPGLLTKSAPAAVLTANATIMSDFHPHGMKTMVRALAEADLRRVLPRIEVPTLLLYGDKDVRSPLSLGQDLQRQIPDSELVVIPGIGHLSNFEAPDRFNAEVRNFLSSQRD